jgi:hypothetical protein
MDRGATEMIFHVIFSPLLQQHCGLFCARKLALAAIPIAVVVKRPPATSTLPAFSTKISFLEERI